MQLMQSPNTIFEKKDGSTRSLYDNLVSKFEFEKVVRCLPSDIDWNEQFQNNLPIFMNVATIFENEDGDKMQKGHTLALVHHLLKQNVNQLVELFGTKNDGHT